MPTATITDAAAALGFKSRSTLQRLKRDGFLKDYLLPPDATGRQLLELEPRGLPTLRQFVAGVVQPRINGHARPDRPRPDRRFEHLAAELTDALEPIAGPSLAAREAAALFESLPEAVARALGVEGLQRLAEAVAAEVEVLTPPEPEPEPADHGAFWSEFGRWAPDEPLEEQPFWEHAAAIAGGMMGDPPLSWTEARNLHGSLSDAIDSLNHGARWDQARWDVASARLYIEDWAGSPSEDAELRQLTDRGNLPPDLLAAALELLPPQPAPEPLPVVLTD
jgi:hypothetical protein